MASSDCTVDFRVFFGGKFVLKEGKTEYEGGALHMNCVNWVKRVNVKYLRDMGDHLMDGKNYDIWYKKSGKNVTAVKSKVLSEVDVVELLKSKDFMNTVTLYITEDEKAAGKKISRNPKRPNFGSSSSVNPSLFDKKPNLRAHPSLNFFSSSDPDLHETPYSVTFQNSCDPNSTFNASSQHIPLSGQPVVLRRSPRQHKSSYSTLPNTQNSSLNKSQPQKLPVRRLEKLPSRRNLNFGSRSAAVKESSIEACEALNEEVTEKAKGRPGAVKGKIKGKSKQVEGKTESSRSEKGKAKRKGVNGAAQKIKARQADVESKYDSEDNDEENLSDIEQHLDEFERVVDEDDELFGDKETSSILKTVQQSLGESVWGVDDLEVRFTEEDDDLLDEDDLVSLHGSDEEVDPYPTFNPEKDFSKPIVLKIGLKFASNKILRKALVYHAIKNGYDFYYLHNTSLRVTVFCKKRCVCKWDNNRSKLMKCTCNAKKKCMFKVHARRLKLDETFQIKSLHLEHTCVMTSVNTKVSSEFLAEMYLEFWRSNTNWKINEFQEHVFKDLGVEVSYNKCWLARARANLIIYGNGKDQYSRVWDYAKAIRKHNNGSSAFVVCDNIERPPPLFKRMYICLQACKEGFLKGCRPIIGVDGCHLKGPFPGICLVAVGVDGNNNIFPVAWAVVETENTHSWTWFLELLVGDLEKADGEGLTFMSDRQKGLIDALKSVAPKAFVRFCVRHIWANFKLTYSGEVYKNTFWKAARATTKVEFDSEMEAMKFLSTEAWAYLNAIDPKHWSRHAFDTNCKSNMSLNNVCESFNAVLKEARSKPILTQMEWMRRYVMQRNCQKRDAASTYDGRMMPYVMKYLKKTVGECRMCKPTKSTVDIFEVDCQGDTMVVNLKERTCTCFQWDLSGLPCTHALVCILKQRMDPEDFVDEVYSKERYMKSYNPAILPMPGMKQWEKSGLPEPLPPPLRNMPGRPSSKKRKKEVGEGKSSHQVKRQKKSNKCSRCGQLGHYKRTCKNPAATPKESDNKGGRPKETSAWANQEREKAMRRKAVNDASTQPPPTSTSLHHYTAATSSSTEPSTSFTQLLSQAMNMEHPTDV